jgi:hypothetical protein
MAIIPAMDSIEVEVLVNNQTVTEYVDPETIDVETSPNERKISKYIEAKTGATFAIRFKTSPTFLLLHSNVDLLFCIYIDNKYMVANVIHRSKLRFDHTELLHSHRYTKNKQWFERPFSFNQLNIGE